MKPLVLFQPPIRNMTSRTIGVQTFALSYDAENRLVKVCNDTNQNASCDTGETQVASFTYDGDGNRVKSTINGTVTYFAGNYYEQTVSSVRKYYYAGMQRVAMRVDNTVSYLLSDQLGSTTITTNSGGDSVGELRYDAWGVVRYSRYSSGTIQPKYQYTGQYAETTLGLDFFQARYYDPSIGRFISADSIVPPGVQGYDRYAYANNSPLVYADPSGHLHAPVTRTVMITARAFWWRRRWKWRWWRRRW